MTVNQFMWGVAVGVVSSVIASYVMDRISPSQSTSEM